LTTVEVLQALEVLHPQELGEWSFTREVFGIDAYAVRLYRGDRPHYRRVAYEVKVSREDFLNEVRKPEKRDRALALSHHFYFAMPAALAERCFADVVQHMPEAGILAVYPDRCPHPVGGSPFPGVGPRVHVRTLRKAQMRSCRGWTADEWSNLLRRHTRPPVAEETWRLEYERANERAVAADRARRIAEQKANEADGRLQQLAARLVPPARRYRRIADGVVAALPPSTFVTLEQVEPPPERYRGSLFVKATELLDEWEPLQIAAETVGGVA
jgi:hypothetical protein